VLRAGVAQRVSSRSSCGSGSGTRSVGARTLRRFTLTGSALVEDRAQQVAGAGRSHRSTV
jgi:hypothetical protein